MDRQTVYAGQIPLETDILKTGQNVMVGLAKLASSVFGTNTLVDAFTVTPTTPAGLNVIVTAGAVYQIENLEQSAWSSLASDTHSILKQGLLLDPVTMGITPPGTVGYSQNFLVEVQYQDTDSGSVVLPYFNAGNPSSPYSGPGNAGTAQNTVRKGVAAVQIKAGIAASTGTQTTPTPDAGWTGIYVVTVANGATTITSGNISVYSGAPFLATNGYLPQIPTGVQNGSWIFGSDISTTINNIVVNLAPALTAYAVGQKIRVKMNSDCTGAAVMNVNSLGNKSLTKKPGAQPLQGGEWKAGDIVDWEFDGTQWQGVGLGVRAPLTQNVNFYVNPSLGSDTLYDGSSSAISGTHGPFATLTKALAVVAQFAPGTFGATINLSAGTYTVASPNFFQTAAWAHCTVNIIGAGSSTLLTSSGVSSAVLVVQGANNYNLSNMAFSSTSTYVGGAVCVESVNGAVVYLNGGITFNGFTTASGVGAFQASQASTLEVVGSITLAGSITNGYFFWANGAGSTVVFDSSPVITISAAVTCTAFAASVDGDVGVSGTRPATFVNPGNVTGSKFAGSLNGVFAFNGNGTSYFPGSTAGTLQSGAQAV